MGERPLGFDAIVVALGDRIRMLRKARSLSQEALGHMADLHRTQIGYLEQARSDPQLSTLVKVSRGLGVEVADLLRTGALPDAADPG